jgi:hypothetical protein
MPWFMYVIGALPLGIMALAMYHAAIGSGPPWGGSMRFVWLGLALVSILVVTTLGRLASVPVGIKVGVGLGVGAVDYLIVGIVFLANRPPAPELPDLGNAERGGQVVQGGAPDAGQKAPQAPKDGGQKQQPAEGSKGGGQPKPQERVVPDETGPFRAHLKPIRWMALSPGGETLATAAEDGFVMVWEVNTGKRTGALHVHEHGASRVAFSPDGKMVAALGPADRAVIKVWDVGSPNPRFSAEEPQRTYFGLAFVPEANLVVTIQQWQIKFFDVPGQRELFAVRRRDPLRGLALAPNGKTLFVGDAKKRVLFVEPTTAKVDPLAFVSVHGVPQELAVSPDGTYLAIAAAEGLDVFHLGIRKRRIDFDKLPRDPVRSVAFAPDSNRLAFVQNGTATVWDQQQRKRVGALTHPGGIEQALFHPDGRRLILRHGSEVTVQEIPR